MQFKFKYKYSTLATLTPMVRKEELGPACDMPPAVPCMAAVDHVKWATCKCQWAYFVSGAHYEYRW